MSLLCDREMLATLGTPWTPPRSGRRRLELVAEQGEELGAGVEVEPVACVGQDVERDDAARCEVLQPRAVLGPDRTSS